MTWAIAISLIEQYGLPLAISLWKKWTTGADPTQADWDELTAMANQTAKDRMLLALTKAGVDPNSEQGKALLAAASGTP
jgi:hypothetical protein